MKSKINYRDDRCEYVEVYSVFYGKMYKCICIYI